MLFMGKCLNCHENEATIFMSVSVNGHAQRLQLCPSCYEQLKQGSIQFQTSSSKGNVNASGGGSCPINAQTQDEVSESVLKQFGQNITELAKSGLIDPVIGRDDEVEQVTEILNRRNKNNPVLIGEPGVGKTAIAEGLALRIIEGKVPSKLRNKQIISLDVGSLLSGTSYRGQFEERIQQLVKELESSTDTILFIDEIHQLVGAGKTEGSTDAGNMLKPALARGAIQLIGATTLKEYREIEKDAALERRFQPIIVKEPTVADTVTILQGLAPKYEAYHAVTYPLDTLEACAELSERYIQDRFLPDKAIDLLDEAGAKLNLQAGESDKASLEARLEEIVKKKAEAAEKEDYEQAAKLRQEELIIEEKLKGAETTKPVVTVEHIQQLIEKKTGIPVKKLEQSEQDKLRDLQLHLNEKVIGQVEATEAIAKAIRRSRVGFRNEERPQASFLFVGQTGVGKTELTKVLAEELFGDRHALIRLDMSEYMEKHTVAKLIGSPPGYVGHEEAGQLTEQVRRRPYSIILLDEMEKAHPDVQHLFLQVLEDGRLTDSKGRTVSFKDTIIIMTSNAKNLEATFKTEFLNRLDSIIEFNALEKEHLLQIVDLMLADILEQGEKRGMTITISDEAKEKLVELGYDPTYGARPLRRVIQEQIEDKIVDLILENEDVSACEVNIEDGKIVVKK